MFKVMGGGEGRQPCSRSMGWGVRGVSYVQDDGGGGVEGRPPCSR